MASITIRQLDDDLKSALRVQAAQHGHSMEEEVREILRRAVASPESGRDLVARIRARVAIFGGADLPEADRGAARELPKFN